MVPKCFEGSKKKKNEKDWDDEDDFDDEENVDYDDDEDYDDWDDYEEDQYDEEYFEWKCVSHNVDLNQIFLLPIIQLKYLTLTN